MKEAATADDTQQSMQSWMASSALLYVSLPCRLPQKARLSLDRSVQKQELRLRLAGICRN